jgi:4-methyl-5(b-hydroxyethyl)-thiazole monophosphate biosynthesis
MLFVPDVAWDAAQGPWDMVVLPGGMGGTERMMAHDGLKALIRDRVSTGAAVAAICAAPLVLDAAGVLPERRFTCYPGLETRIQTPGRQPERLVDAGAVVTSQGPSTAMEFALHLVRRLQGEAVRRRVAEGVLVK